MLGRSPPYEENKSCGCRDIDGHALAADSLHQRNYPTSPK